MNSIYKSPSVSLSLSLHLLPPHPSLHQCGWRDNTARVHELFHFLTFFLPTHPPSCRGLSPSLRRLFPNFLSRSLTANSCRVFFMCVWFTVSIQKKKKNTFYSFSSTTCTMCFPPFSLSSNLWAWEGQWGEDLEGLWDAHWGEDKEDVGWRAGDVWEN